MTIIGRMAGFVALMLLSGCTSFVKELKSPPFPMVMTHNSRVVGIQISYQSYGLKLGFCSDTLTFIPCATNAMSIPTFSDRFKLGQNGFDTSISQQTDTGWKDQPPPLMKHLFSPKDQNRHSSSHGTAFAQKQAQAMVSTNRPMSAVVGALDSLAPVFALQFSDTERRPIAVLELNADDAFNTYSVIGTITYTNSPPPLPK